MLSSWRCSSSGCCAVGIRTQLTVGMWTHMQQEKQHMPPGTMTPSQVSGLERPELYINRDLSWIEFNRRVFEEAQDTRHPLLERVKFLSIFDTNLDEFIMIRLAGLQDQVVAHVTTASPDGRTPEQQLSAVRERLNPQLQEVRQYWRSELLPLLAEQ